MSVRTETAESAHRPTGREKWDAMPRWQQTGVVALAAVEVVMTTRAAIDLARRPRRQVRGPKLLWWLGLTVQPFGPMAYLGWGRRR